MAERKAKGARKAYRPPLKPCPKCGAALEYWDDDFAACTSRTCAFTYAGRLAQRKKRSRVEKDLPKFVSALPKRPLKNSRNT